MYNCNSYNDELFDALLTIAFNRLLDEEDAEMPSDEELAEMFPVPQKQVRKMQRYAKRLKHRAPMPIVHLRRFAVACLVILSLAFVTFATVPVVRDAIKETVATWCGKYVQFDFAGAHSRSGDAEFDIYQLNIGYIPEGFELVSNSETRSQREYYYNKTGDYLAISIYSSSIAEFAADIELTEYEKGSINGYQSYALYNNNTRDMTLIFGNDQYAVYISAIADKKIVEQIAKNIN